MTQVPTNKIGETAGELERVRADVMSAIDAHHETVNFAGGDVAASDIIRDLEDAVMDIDSALTSLRWASSTFEERYL
ncbi:MAG: hypothetical protein RI544_07995 [Haloquadratum sp.]|nr:hypothetical protein [Haloferacaceae archaeon]MDR9446047.1 hypothetical protein [Haloquadratum sp.]